MSNKLFGIPHVYYLNLDERVDRREYTESQYKTWGISNYTRVSASEFKVDNFENWTHLIHPNNKLYDLENKICSLTKKPRKILIETAISVSYLEIIKNWLINSNDPYMIIMEDDYDLSYIEYWHFDWEYLMNNIPYDWDCIQMSFENNLVFPCYLHPIMPYHGCGASLINRSYAEKLLKIHLIDGKYSFDQKISNYKWCAKKRWSNGDPQPLITLDYFMGHCGRTYVLPLFLIDSKFGSYEQNYNRNDGFTDVLKFVKKCYDIWWKQLRDKYTLEEFFMFGKENDLHLTPKYVNNFYV